ncbi:unnamed protein product [Rotaria sordida]|uniref:Transposase n=1 Tax=Rotaria sordida TaxID=392033 RepID=A0A820AAH4_9BILA|nr:unnamed protein product [Rotaria sordida]
MHSLLAERIYPIVAKVRIRIRTTDADFPVQSSTTLWRWMRKIGFKYQRTSKVKVPLDTLTFMAARTRYFASLDELHSTGTKIFWYDETWANQNEEKRFVWTDGMTGKGRMRDRQNKGIHYFYVI